MTNHAACMILRQFFQVYLLSEVSQKMCLSPQNTVWKTKSYNACVREWANGRVTTSGYSLFGWVCEWKRIYTRIHKAGSSCISVSVCVCTPPPFSQCPHTRAFAHTFTTLVPFLPKVWGKWLIHVAQTDVPYHVTRDSPLRGTVLTGHVHCSSIRAWRHDLSTSSVPPQKRLLTSNFYIVLRHSCVTTCNSLLLRQTLTIPNLFKSSLYNDTATNEVYDISVLPPRIL